LFFEKKSLCREWLNVTDTSWKCRFKIFFHDLDSRVLHLRRSRGTSLVHPRCLLLIEHYKIHLARLSTLGNLLIKRIFLFLRVRISFFGRLIARRYEIKEFTQDVCCWLNSVTSSCSIIQVRKSACCNVSPMGGGRLGLFHMAFW
jgi:hypothetical protein